MVEAFTSGGVRGFLHVPERGAGPALALTHGAGGNAEMALLVRVAGAFEQAGVAVLRFDLPFRQKRASGPPAPAASKADREGVREAVAALRARGFGPVAMGGQSYGGRQASIVAAEDADAAEALLLLSYPLHPPGKPEKLRTAHLPTVRTPALFVHGERDPFATLDELRRAVKMMRGATAIVEVEGAGHELRHGDFAVMDLVVAPFMTFLA